MPEGAGERRDGADLRVRRAGPHRGGERRGGEFRRRPVEDPALLRQVVQALVREDHHVDPRALLRDLVPDGPRPLPLRRAGQGPDPQPGLALEIGSTDA